ncbi:MAG: prepilin-type N-terminal cleavage/methylation domain-containing protein [Verrucomicrobia bacterium]|nr:prepilin-type N-terminal cleavage/methylation domain-containing protein [Verrucomicrobiota bacterium]
MNGLCTTPGRAGDRRALRPARRPAVFREAAFTLLEMLVVIGIIGIVTALALPSLRMNKGNVMTAASRQVLEDLQIARLRAISGRTTVFVVFFPHQGAVWNGVSYGIAVNAAQSNYFTTNRAGNALLNGQLASYALYTKHSVGDQPGSDNPRYITEWKTLPDGTFFPPAIFINTTIAPAIFFNITNTTETFPVPDTASAIRYPLPYIAFDANGRLLGRTADIGIPLTLGSVFLFKDPTGETNQVIDPDVIETPPGNWTNNFVRLRINWITGRAKVERPELP